MAVSRSLRRLFHHHTRSRSPSRVPFQPPSVERIAQLQLQDGTTSGRGHVVNSAGSRIDAVGTITSTTRQPLQSGSDMYRRYAFGFPPARQFSTMSSSTTPIEDAIRSKVTAALQPSTLEIHNDSHLHSHHKPMIGNTSKETHFRIVIISEAFRSKMQSARHRMIYALLREEMAQDNGIHALQLRTLTPEEEEKQKAKAEQQRQQKAEEQLDTAE